MIVVTEKKITNALIAGIIILTVFYNIGAGVCIFFNVNPSIFNLAYKMIGSMLIIYALAGGLMLNKNRTFPKSTLIVLMFWAIYTVRLLYDIEIAKVPFGFSKTEVYSFAFGGALNLTLSIIICGKNIDIRKLIKYFKQVLIIANLIIIVLLLFKTTQIDIATLFLRRSYFSTDAEDLAIINSITIGINGGLLVLVSIVDIWFRNPPSKSQTVKFGGPLNGALALLGLINLLLGGSRGPFGFCGLLLLILFLLKLKRNNFNTFFLLKAFIAIFIMAGVFLYFFGDLLTSENFALFNRLSSLSESSDPSDINRAEQVQSAWQQFLHSPIIGDRFVERVSDFYPHNVVLEALMATGIIGTTFFIGFVIMSIYKSFSLFGIRNENYFLKLAVINLFFLLACLVSGCLWNSLEMWAFSLLVIIQDKKEISAVYSRRVRLSIQ